MRALLLTLFMLFTLSFSLHGSPVASPTPTQVGFPPVLKVPVLMYHHIDDQSGEWYVPRKNFGQQMAFLAENGYRSTTLTAYLDAYQNGTALPDKSVLITFDDGYEDAYTQVY